MALTDNGCVLLAVVCSADAERLSVEKHLRLLNRILDSRLTYQQHQQSALAVASKLSQRIATTSHATNTRYVHMQRRLQLQRMEDEMTRTQRFIEHERQRMYQRRVALVTQAQQLQQRLTALHEAQQLLSQQQTTTATTPLQSLLQLSRLQLRLRRRKQLEQLLTVLPLHTVPPNRRDPTQAADSTEYMIRGLRIPQQQLYNFSEEQLSTAFAYVAQLVDALSRLFDVRLRYRPVYRASRSYVWDDAISGSMFPLFWKSTERERFETAVVLLNKAIEQLRAEVRERGDGYGLVGVGGGVVGGDIGEWVWRGKGHGTLENVKALLDLLLPNDEH